MLGLSLPGDYKVDVLDFPVPIPGPNDALIRIQTAAICGSDLHHYAHPYDPQVPVFVVGHEPCGIVEQVGSAVTCVKPGQRVALYHWEGCGVCKACSKGEYKHCKQRRGFGGPDKNGADAEYMLVNAAQSCYPLPDNLTYEDGSMIACNAGTGYAALKKVELNSAKTLCIYGLGPVGLATFFVARAIGAAKIYGVDPNAERRAFAEKLGFDATFSADAQGVEQLLKETGGVDCQVETSGSLKAHASIVDTAAPHGRIAIIGMSGIYDTQGGLNLCKLIHRELTVMGSHVMTRPEFIELIELCSEKNVHFDAMITHRYTLSQAKEALEAFRAGEVGKFMFVF